MKFTKCGNAEGKLLVYFHGAPGAPKEGLVFDEPAKAAGVQLICLDRFSIDKSIRGEKYYQFLAKEILKISNGKTVDIIGFSIGCHVAIKVAALLQNNVDNLHLISAAAPLEAGDFLDKMAGKMVFNLAGQYPLLFSLLSYWQSLLAIVAPKLLYKLLFSSATGKDKALSEQVVFEGFITPLLKDCFSRNVSGYIRDVKQYIEPWNESLAKCQAPTHIWHGQSDNWSPVEMAHHLKKSMPKAVAIEIMDGLSHYSCLYETVPKIMMRLSKAEQSISQR